MLLFFSINSHGFDFFFWRYPGFFGDNLSNFFSFNSKNHPSKGNRKEGALSFGKGNFADSNPNFQSNTNTVASQPTASGTGKQAPSSLGGAGGLLSNEKGTDARPECQSVSPIDPRASGVSLHHHRENVNIDFQINIIFENLDIYFFLLQQTQEQHTMERITERMVIADERANSSNAPNSSPSHGGSPSRKEGSGGSNDQRLTIPGRVGGLVSEGEAREPRYQVHSVPNTASNASTTSLYQGKVNITFQIDIFSKIWPFTFFSSTKKGAIHHRDCI